MKRTRIFSNPTVNQLFDAVESARGLSPVSLTLDRDFLVSLNCRQCDISVEVNKPRQLVKARDGVCTGCSMPMHAAMVSSIERTDELAGRTLAEIGIPAYDIVKVESEDATTFVLLAGDRERVCPALTGAG